jgi:hypothetical protein
MSLEDRQNAVERAKAFSGLLPQHAAPYEKMFAQEAAAKEKEEKAAAELAKEKRDFENKKEFAEMQLGHSMTLKDQNFEQTKELNKIKHGYDMELAKFRAAVARYTKSGGTNQELVTLRGMWNKLQGQIADADKELTNLYVEKRSGKNVEAAIEIARAKSAYLRDQAAEINAGLKVATKGNWELTAPPMVKEPDPPPPEPKTWYTEDSEVQMMFFIKAAEKLKVKIPKKGLDAKTEAKLTPTAMALYAESKLGAGFNHD